MDGWIEVKIKESEMGQEILGAVQTLRSMWAHLLEMKLEASKSQFCLFFFLVCLYFFNSEHYSRGESYYDDSVDNTVKISAMEELLATKLAEYLDSTFSYSLLKLPSTALTNLYKGSPKSV